MRLWKNPAIFLTAMTVALAFSGCGKTADEADGKPIEAASVTETPVQTETPAVTEQAETETPAPTEAAVTGEPSVDPADSALEEIKESLLGHWESSYHVNYLEIKEDELILRDGMKVTTLITGYSLEEADGKVRIVPDSDELTYNYNEYGVNSDRVFATIPEIIYTEDRIEMKYLSSYLPDENEKYIFERAEKGPFDDITIRDDEFLPELQGKWVETDSEGISYALLIEGNTLTIAYETEEELDIREQIPIHVISYDWAPERLYLIHTDLVNVEFYSFTRFEYEDGLLKSNLMVLDADWDTGITFMKVE